MEDPIKKKIKTTEICRMSTKTYFRIQRIRFFTQRKWVVHSGKRVIRTGGLPSCLGSGPCMSTWCRPIDHIHPCVRCGKKGYGFIPPVIRPSSDGCGQ